MSYLDFHVHTILSDGILSAEDLIAEAKQCVIKVLTITDHNCTHNLTKLRLDNPDIFLVQGSEINCIYTDFDDMPHEIHVIALGFDPNQPEIQNMLNKNQPNRKLYLKKNLKKLEGYRVGIGTYNTLKKEYPLSGHIGRNHITNKMLRLSYVNTIEEAFDEYIGDFGKCKAYVKPPFSYVSIEECIETILSSGGIAILAHLFSYQMNDKANRILARYFKKLAKNYGGIETSYRRYSEEERNYLRFIADEYNLLYSAGSNP